MEVLWRAEAKTGVLGPLKDLQRPLKRGLTVETGQTTKVAGQRFGSHGP